MEPVISLRFLAGSLGGGRFGGRMGLAHNGASNLRPPALAAFEAQSEITAHKLELCELFLGNELDQLFDFVEAEITRRVAHVTRHRAPRTWLACTLCLLHAFIIKPCH